MIKPNLWKKYKKEQSKISMITCYDFWSAKLIDQTSVSAVLVGDSVANIYHGFEHTTSCTLEIMRLHTAAVARGMKKIPIVTDMPFMEVELSDESFLNASRTLIQAGAHAIKVEGAHKGVLSKIKKLVRSGVPVMGHIGLTPQSVHQLGGYKVQGKNEESGEQLLQQAKQLEEAGVFSIVIECVPEQLAAQITEVVEVPTIGIGAGVRTDGQILVLQDLLGLQEDFNAKFVRKFDDLAGNIKAAVNNYAQEVTNQTFPSKEESY